MKYEQDWKAYDKAKTQECVLFKILLEELLAAYFTHKKKRMYTTDKKILMMTLIVYYKLDFRKAKGFLKSILGIETPAYKTLSNFFNDKDITSILDDLILITALPLAQIETTGATDATGFTNNSIKDHWEEYKWSIKDTRERNWVKVHAFSLCKSNAIISVKVTNKNVHDINMLEPLLKDTSKYFDLKDFVADKAYSSRKVLNTVVNLGMSPIIPFKSSTTGASRGSMTWVKWYRYFRDNQDEFYQRYHKRSNAETCFFMLKKRFNNYLRTKSFVSNENEVKLKVLCHNICVLIQERFESEIEVDLKSCIERTQTMECV